MTLTETIHCPTCGNELFEVDFDADDSFTESGVACENKCGWVEAEQQGESLAISVSPCTY